MKKIVISSLVLASAVLFSSCTIPGQKNEKKTDTMMPSENTMMKDDSAMMKQDSDDAMMKKDDTTADGMMKADVKVESGAMMQK